MSWQHPVEGELRQHVVRRDLGNGSQLIGLHVQLGGVVIATVADGALLVQVVTAFNTDLVTFQVLEVIRIADLGVVDFSQYAGVQATLVLPVEHVALVGVVGLALAVVVIVVEVRGTELAFAGLGQVAELAFHQQAALGHVARVQRGIVVGCQVEVVRGHEHKAGVGAAAEGRRQETGLAAIVDREIDVRGVEHRNVLDPQRHVGGRTETGGRVQRDVVALELPGVAAWFARGVRAVLETDDRVFSAFGIQRTAADARLVQHIFGVVDLGRTGVQLHIGVVADAQGTVVTQAYLAIELATAFSLIQAGFVGFDLHAALTHHDVTGQGRNLLILLIAGGLGANKGRGVAFAGRVVHARTDGLHVRAGAVRTGFGQLGRGQLVAWYPVEVAVVVAARLETAALGLGYQRGLLDLLAGLAAGTCSPVAVRRTRWQLRHVGFWCAIPAPRSRHGTVILLLGKRERRGERLHGQQTAGYQQRKFFTKRGGFQCHLISPGFLRAISPRWGTARLSMVWKRFWIIKHDPLDG